MEVCYNSTPLWQGCQQLSVSTAQVGVSKVTPPVSSQASVKMHITPCKLLSEHSSGWCQEGDTCSEVAYLKIWQKNNNKDSESLVEMIYLLKMEHKTSKTHNFCWTEYGVSKAQWVKQNYHILHTE